MNFKKKRSVRDRQTRKDGRAMIAVYYETYLRLRDIAHAEGCTIAEATTQLLNVGLEQYDLERERRGAEA